VVLGGTTTVVCSGGFGLLLLMHPEMPTSSGNRIMEGMSIFFMALSSRSLLREPQDINFTVYWGGNGPIPVAMR
jgi:hypothetical protein